MSPYPLEEARALGPMRLVLTTYPSEAAARTAVGTVLERRLAACAKSMSVGSRYWWKGRIESAGELLVLFTTAPKRVGALFAFLLATHPYDVPEVVELDVPRVAPRYLEYLDATLGRVPSGERRRHPRRSGAPRARGARGPGRTRARRRRPSR